MLFEHKKKKAGLSANRPSHNWAQNNRYFGMTTTNSEVYLREATCKET